MPTVLYNTETGECLTVHQDGYKVNGRPGIVRNPIVELEIFCPGPPEFDPNTHSVVASKAINLEDKTCTMLYELVPLFDEPEAPEEPNAPDPGA